MLLGAIFTHFSVFLVYGLTWLLAVGEFIRVGFFRKSWAKVLGSVFFALFTATILFGVWKITPRSDSPPTLDQQIDAFAKRFPWLTHEPTITVASAPLVPSTPASTVPFAIATTAGMVSMQRDNTPMFLRDDDEKGTRAVVAVNEMLNFRITNLQDVDSVIREIDVERETKEGKWVHLIRIPGRDVTMLFIVQDKSQAKSFKPPSLEKILADQAIEHGHTVEGWVFCEYPYDEDFVDSYRVSLTDSKGMVFHSKPLNFSAKDGGLAGYPGLPIGEQIDASQYFFSFRDQNGGITLQ